MRKVFIVSITIILLFIYIIPVFAEESDTGTISGMIYWKAYDYGSLQYRVKNMIVQLLFNGEVVEETTTSVNGFYRFTNLRLCEENDYYQIKLKGDTISLYDSNYLKYENLNIDQIMIYDSNCRNISFLDFDTSNYFQINSNNKSINQTIVTYANKVQAIYIDTKVRIEDYNPDFYLEKYNGFIEVINYFGRENTEYFTEQKEYNNYNFLNQKGDAPNGIFDNSIKRVYYYYEEKTDHYGRVENATIDIKTGEEPFDDNDDKWNDSSSTNDLIRNGDFITYNIKANTITENNYEEYIGGHLYFEIYIPEEIKNYVSFEVDDNYNQEFIENGEVIENGSAFSGRVKNRYDNLIAPNEIEFSLKLLVHNAPHRLKIVPTIALKLNGNEDYGKYIIEDINPVYANSDESDCETGGRIYGNVSIETIEGEENIPVSNVKFKLLEAGKEVRKLNSLEYVEDNYSDFEGYYYLYEMPIFYKRYSYQIKIDLDNISYILNEYGEEEEINLRNYIIQNTDPFDDIEFDESGCSTYFFFNSGSIDRELNLKLIRKHSTLGTVTANYLDKDTNEELLEKEVLEGNIDEEYETHYRKIDNYYLEKLPDNQRGLFDEEDIDVNYLYKKITPLKTGIELSFYPHFIAIPIIIISMIVKRKNINKNKKY